MLYSWRPPLFCALGFPFAYPRRGYVKVSESGNLLEGGVRAATEHRFAYLYGIVTIVSSRSQREVLVIEPGKVFAVTTYGVLGREDIARKGIEAFMGMVGQVHIDCSHWWCNQQERDLLLMVEFYYSSDEVQNFIGGYLCPVLLAPEDLSFLPTPHKKS